MKIGRSLLLLILSVILLASGSGMALADTSSAPLLLESFSDNSINPAEWSLISMGAGPSVEETNQRLEITFPADSTGTVMQTGVTSLFNLQGDFDIQVDYQLITWPQLNGVRLALRATPGGVVERASWSARGAYVGEGYGTDMQGSLVRVYPFMEGTEGKLRLVRTGAQLDGYYLDNDGTWIIIGGATVPTEAVYVGLDAWSHDDVFMFQPVKLAFDNLVINSGTLYYPVSGVTLDKTSLQLTAGGSAANLAATVAPENATNKSVTWRSSDEAVATVDDGVVTPVGIGTATITVRTTDGGFEDSCSVTVPVNPGISADFTDNAFKLAIWEWLGHDASEQPIAFTQADLIARMAYQNNKLVVSNRGITSLAGLQHFQNTGLQEFDCTNNQITYWSSLPDSLLRFYCPYNGLSSLPTLPVGLLELGCAHNNFSSLPELPANLQVLLCFENKLTELPALPESLTEIYCAHNQINYLPENLPDNLQYLWCFNNNLDALPSLPAGLIELRCAANQLTQLPSLPGSLQLLYCFDNSLASLPDLPAGLIDLRCAANQLTQLPTLPGSLQILYCYNNSLASLPELPDSLIELRCASNQLTDLPALPAALSVALRCDLNYLDVFAGDLKDKIDSCGAAEKTVTPQYRYAYTGNGISLDFGNQVAIGSLTRQQSDDGTSWSDITSVNPSDFDFSSSNTSIASVDSDGNITAGEAGTCDIYALYHGIDAKLTKTIIPVTVSNPSIPVTGVTLDLNNLDMTVGGATAVLTATVQPENAANPAVTWNSDNEAVATVVDGVVTPVGIGTANITVTTVDGSFEAACLVNVAPVTPPDILVTSITVTGANDATSVGLGKTLQMNADVLPSNATDKSVNWSVTNGSGTATIDSNGLLTGTAAGIVEVTAAANDGSGVEGSAFINVVAQQVTSISVKGARGATSLAVDKTLMMSASVLPKNASNKTVTWSVINGTGTATISTTGLLTGVAGGKVTVVATANDGSGTQGTLEIAVFQPVTQIIVSGADGATTVQLNQTLQMIAEVNPGANQDVTWSVKKGTGNATITSSGLLTGTRKGTVTVTAAAKDGSGVKKSVIITVL